MMHFPNSMLLAFAGIAACFAMSAPAHAQDTWKVTSHGLGWELHEQGDWFVDPQGAKVLAVYSNGAMRFSIGCTFGSYIDVAWQPSRPLSGAVAQTVFSIDGKTVSTREFLPGESASAEYGWAEQGGDALGLLQAIHANWVGTLEISGGGVTDTIPFDEETMGGVSEVILFACGQ